MLRSTALLFSLALSATLSAQSPFDSTMPAPTVVAADAGAIRPAFVPIGTFVRTLALLRDGQERQLGTITEHVAEQGDGGSAELIRAQEITMGSRTIIDTAVSDRATLAMLSLRGERTTTSLCTRPTDGI